MHSYRWLRVLALALWLTQSSCQSDCGIADGIHRLDSLTHNGVTYALILRVSGIHDKVLFVELYDAEPKFDPCGRSPAKPLWSEALEDQRAGKFVSKIVLRKSASEAKLDVVYTPNKEDALNIYQARLSRE